MTNRRTLEALIGKNPDMLRFPERAALAGQWIALAAYRPDNLALRRIAAIAETPEQCREALLSQGKNPDEYQFVFIHGV